MCLPPQSVRIARSGRQGRYAVIYFSCKADALKALADRAKAAKAEPSAANSSLLNMGEAHVFLADDELADV